MRTTLKIDDDVLSVARALAARTGKSLGDAVSELARRGFSPRLKIDEKNGIPHFRVPEGTPPITDEDVRKALSDWPWSRPVARSSRTPPRSGYFPHRAVERGQRGPVASGAGS